MKGTAVAIAVGIEMPADFPLSLYNEVHSKVAPLQPRFVEPFRHYAGAWNAVAFRYRAAAEADDAYRDSTSKPADVLQRYAQEKTLFGFFANAVAVLDSLAYGLYAIGATVDQRCFPLTAAALRSIQPQSVAAQFTKCFSTDAMGPTLLAVSNDTMNVELREIRNALSHRASSTRTYEMDVGVRWLVDHLQLKSGIQSIDIDAGTTSRYRSWLSKQLSVVLESAGMFALARL